MKNYLEDPRLLTLQEIIDDPKNKINTVKFLKGAAHKDDIYVHSIDDTKVKKKIYFGISILPILLYIIIQKSMQKQKTYYLLIMLFYQVYLKGVYAGTKQAYR